MVSINKTRWRLFRMISVIGWWICPEPQRSDMQGRMSFDQKPLGPEFEKVWDENVQTLYKA